MDSRSAGYPWALAFWLACATATAFVALAHALQHWDLTLG
jgi:hypothetical protein